MWRSLADGSWLTADRVRAVARVAGAASLLFLLFLLLTSQGTLDRWGRPLGTDFSNVWTAGRMAIEGRAADAWDWGAHHRVQQEAHADREVPFYGWHYPPPFLLVAALLGFLPYLAALAVWQGASLAGALAVVRRILPHRDALPPVLAAPVVLVCLAHGHNGFLTAALLGGGLLLLERRPLLAGLLLGCLVYKPQFALIIPPLLLVTRNGRAFAGAAFSSGALVALTLMLWGWPVWQAFLDSLPLTRQIVIEAGATGWGKIQSPFAMIRMWGGGVDLAYAVQGMTSAAAIGAALWTARFAGPGPRGAAVAAAAILSTPYVLDYDFVLLGIGCAFLVADGRQRGFLGFEKSLLALVWIAPLFARPLATLTLVPAGQITALIVLALAVRRAVLVDDAGGAALRSSPFRRSRAGSGR
ncbi:glycosyltransferase family 87 protein [Sphingosinicella terrae]|uniref:glycosyltransferase family 87 protein n=1 Tax=Sphingosinicella terrae TaxID=2172047 RepID=UPI000E0CEBC7|nr:glycosyltransferase family 87 protein [Sphingosinicella terrae]